LLGLCTAVGAAGAGPGPSLAGEARPFPHAKGTREVLEQAVEQAKRGSSVTVSIDLDETTADPGRVEKGDLVRIHYTISLEDGSLARATSEGSAFEPGRKKAPGYEEPTAPGPEEFLAGEEAPLPGMREITLGMAVGERKTVRLKPEEAYGPFDPKKMVQLSCVKRMPLLIEMGPEEYVDRFRSFPLVGTEVNLVPYFKARVQAVTERAARLEFLPRDGERVQEAFGAVTIGTEADHVTITLEPALGAPFEVQGRQGRIVSTDGTTFTVDFNHPAAGKPVLLDLEVVSLKKASQLAGKEIPWLEEHDLGMELARASERPMLLVLYARWCSWSRKLLNETMADPRIRALAEDFVWVKVDSDQEKEWGQRYAQNGFPLTVIVGPDRRVLKRIEGFKDPRSLREELRAVAAQAGRQLPLASRP